jgi:hypothetical protein
MTEISNLPEAQLQGATETETASSSVEQPPKWFIDFAERIDGRIGLLGKDLGKLRERSKGAVAANAAEADGQSAANATASVSHEDVGAAMRLGTLLGKLSPEAAQHIQESLDGGVSYSQALREAELIARFSNSNPNGGATPHVAPTAKAASAQPRTAPNLPKTRAELIALSKNNPQLYKTIMQPEYPFTVPKS